jgi:hypothetical protein
MIIDCILDAVDFDEYSAKEFYDYLTGYYSRSNESDAIANALDSGTNEDIQEAICQYIDANGFNSDIKIKVKSFDWLKRA